MRSLDYAVATTLDPRTPTSAPLPEATRAKFVKRLRDGAQQAFLDAYRSGASDPARPSTIWICWLSSCSRRRPMSCSTRPSNRPAWLSIPLHGLQRLMIRILGGRSQERIMTAHAVIPPQLSRPEADAIAHGRHGDPFKVLGPPRHTAAGRIIRAFSARRAGGRGAAGAATGAVIGKLEALQPDGMFEGAVVDRATIPAAHHLAGRGAGDGGSLFLRPVARRSRPASLRRGAAIFELAKVFGARAMTLEGVEGVGFSVWAPNASRLAVVGDFNAWDSRRHPMRLRFSRRRLGAVRTARDTGRRRYKFDIVGAGGVPATAKKPIRWPTRPRCRPATASVVASPRAFSMARPSLDERPRRATGEGTRRYRSTRSISARG